MMKNFTHITLTILLILISHISFADQANTKYSCMFHIQEKADSVILLGFDTKSDKGVIQLIDNLKKEYNDHSVDLNLYWQGYLQYFQSIIQQTTGNKKKAKECIGNAYKTLEAIKHQSSESYALMALVRSYSINFNRFSVIFISKNAIGLAKKAMLADTLNPRGYYARGSHEFYTPASMRKNKNAEEWLLKAIKLSQKMIDNPYTPSWGEQESYELLIKLYRQTEQKEKAKHMLQKALEKYPNNYQFKKLQGV
ncbi:hypothetical protein OAT16_03030 [Prolixibacteraceae bacterium]|nr:hypothetical protein [Prolixibacteraceae bacterium]